MRPETTERELAQQLREFWSQQDAYYGSISDGSGPEDVVPPDVNALIGPITRAAHRILDVGCGEGSKLRLLSCAPARAVGIDFSPLALQRARDKLPEAQFAVGNAAQLPFADNSFDCVYSTYTLEHVLDAERVLVEMVRVLAPGGHLIIVCPNFGSPLQGSPCSTEDPWKRLKRRLGLSLRWWVRPPTGLEWESVTPRVLTEGRYESDWDATCEPYAGTLVASLRRAGFRIPISSSMIGWVPPHAWSPRSHGSLRRWAGTLVPGLLVALGQMGVGPGRFYGPLIVIAAQKPGRVE
jgi:SAM-dependent methyltransferase